MLNVSEIADEIITREGGYVFDKDDPGGPTNFGITLGTLRGLGADVDANGSINIDDVKQLSKSQAKEIILLHYFEKPKIHLLPEVLQASVFDMNVNAGRHSVRILQRLLAEFDQATDIDGIIGPNTIHAAERAFYLAPHHLADAYGIARRNYYYRLADRRAKSRKYAKRKDGGKGGWIVRAEAFLAPKYHLSQREHSERTAKWA